MRERPPKALNDRRAPSQRHRGEAGRGSSSIKSKGFLPEKRRGLLLLSPGGLGSSMALSFWPNRGRSGLKKSEYFEAGVSTG
jgi:hypothetical protein